LLIYCIYVLLLYCIYALLLYTIFVASNLKKKALPFIRIYTFFFCLNDKLSSVLEKNNTAFFLRSKDNYVAQTFIFNEVQKVFTEVLFFIIAVFLEKRLLFSRAVVYVLLRVLSN
jgi:hypothetical protein